MDILRKKGIKITEADGTPLKSGQYYYWDAQWSNIIMADHEALGLTPDAGPVLRDFCPFVSFKKDAQNNNAFSATFSLNAPNGTELCGTSVSLEDLDVRIPGKDLSALINGLDLLHQQAERDDIPQDTRDFLKSVRLPSPWNMKSSWRVTTGFTRHLLLLWGYSSANPDATILPLTPTSAKWPDAGDRVDLQKKLSSFLTTGSFNWGKFFRWLLLFLLILLLLAGAIGLGKWAMSPRAECAVHGIKYARTCPQQCPKCHKCHLGDNCETPDNAQGAVAPDASNSPDNPQQAIDGAAGKDGQQGADGKDGQQGTDGKDGQQGADGKDGQQGAEGKNGQQGADGKGGQQGTDGKDGQQGADAKDGQQGAEGEDGQQGADGKGGQQGADAKDGQQGADAKDGQQGADAKDGQQGADAKDGQQGADGKGGLQGADGKDGQQGADAKDGQQGADGKDGQQGADAKDGQQGADAKDGQQGADAKDGQQGVDGKDGQPKAVPGQPNEAKQCPICDKPLNDKGECEQLCPQCKAHKTPNGKCPNTCPTHNEHFKDGVCPKRCEVPDCKRHLDADGKCPNVCDKHPDQHKRNGLCPKCDAIIEKVDFFITLNKETKKDGLFFPEFGIQSAEQLETMEVIWRQDDVTVGNAVTFIPKAGFAGTEKHTIVADITYTSDGKQYKSTTPPFVWGKDIAPEVVERHIALVGGRHSDSKGDYYTLKVFSNCSEELDVNAWNVHMDGFKSLKTDKEPQYDRAIRLYISSIPAEGKLNVEATIKPNKKDNRVLKGTFFYSTATKTISESFNPLLSERWDIIRSTVASSVFLCLTSKMSGTAFAVTKNDLITNNHVIAQALKDQKGIIIVNKKWPQGLAVRVVKTNPELDLAWLRLENTEIALPALPIQTTLPRVNEPVAAFGYPYSSLEADKKTLPDMQSTYGVIMHITASDEKLLHDAGIYAGSSGGPLINVNRYVIGINTFLSYTTKDNEMDEKAGVASPAKTLLVAFPDLRPLLTIAK